MSQENLNYPTVNATWSDIILAASYFRVKWRVSFILKHFKSTLRTFRGDYLESLFIAAFGRDDGDTYDTFVPNQTANVHKLEHLIEIQQRVKAGLLTVDEAVEHFRDWQQVQKGMDPKQQAGPARTNEWSMQEQTGISPSVAHDAQNCTRTVRISE